MPLWGVSCVGLLLSFGVVLLLSPRIALPWAWDRRGQSMHVAFWALLHASLVLILGRPWFAMVLVLAFLMLIVQVSNAKYQALREPFVFQDFEYFTDAIKHPRLYIPFLGWGKFFLIALVVIAALWVGLGMEPISERRWEMNGLLGQALGLFGLGGLLLGCSRRISSPDFDPLPDMNRWGLVASLWIYGRAERQPLQLGFGRWQKFMTNSADETPDLVVVQSESFFDPRPWYAGIRRDVLAAFDRCRAKSCQFGPLTVPAFGANTVRSEFAFLSGQPESALGVHRFNPYRRFVDGQIDMLLSVLKAKGYYTACIHPYPASFYTRDKVYPAMGFDEFFDIQSFTDATRFGPYVSDEAVAQQVLEVLKKKTGQPCFVFAITMENHGPLHLETPKPEDVSALYDQVPPEGYEDLTVYLRHLRNADRMVATLSEGLSKHPRPARLCWYGDHVPILDAVYRSHGVPDGHTEYFIWSNQPNSLRPDASVPQPLSIDQLAEALFEHCGW